jgi:S1-C subfamily serine protease
LVKENQKTPPFGIRFLSPTDFGLDVAVQNGGTQVMGITPDSPFAKFGVADADVILTIDGEPATSLQTFRRQLRKGILKESVTLTIRRNNQRITRIVFLDGVPDLARPVAPPPREVRK